MKSLSNFNISPSPKDSGKNSETEARADDQEASTQNKDGGRVSPLVSEASSEAVVLRVHRPGNGLEAHCRSGEKDQHTQHDSMAYSASRSTIERSKTDRTHHYKHIDDQSKSSQEMLHEND